MLQIFCWRSSGRGKDYIKITLQGTACDDVGWIHVASRQDPAANSSADLHTELLGSITGEGGTPWPAASRTGFLSMEMVFQLMVTEEISKGGERKVRHMFENVYKNK
jgi:hypothetical protein